MKEKCVKMVRPACKHEFPALVEVWERSVRATHDFLTKQDIAGLRQEILSAYLPAVNVRLCVDMSGTIQGFIGVLEGKIEMLFIDPEVRGCGIGKKLVAYVVEQLSVSTVDVNEQNVQAVGFYRHMGFSVFARSPLDGQGRPFPLLHMRLGARPETAS